MGMHGGFLMRAKDYSDEELADKINQLKATIDRERFDPQNNLNNSSIQTELIILEAEMLYRAMQSDKV